MPFFRVLPGDGRINASTSVTTHRPNGRIAYRRPGGASSRESDPRMNKISRSADASSGRADRSPARVAVPASVQGIRSVPPAAVRRPVPDRIAGSPAPTPATVRKAPARTAAGDPKSAPRTAEDVDRAGTDRTGRDRIAASGEPGVAGPRTAADPPSAGAHAAAAPMAPGQGPPVHPASDPVTASGRSRLRGRRARRPTAGSPRGCPRDVPAPDDSRVTPAEKPTVPTVRPSRVRRTEARRQPFRDRRCRRSRPRVRLPGPCLPEIARRPGYDPRTHRRAGRPGRGDR